MPKLYLYSADFPAGKVFNNEDAGFSEEGLAKDGWMDCPSKLGLPPESFEKPVDTPVSYNLDDMIGIVKESGYTVLNDFELDSLKHSLRLELAAEAPKPDVEPEPSPYPTKEMTREELVVLGSKHGIKLKMTQKEQTMIDLISDKIETDRIAFDQARLEEQ